MTTSECLQSVRAKKIELDGKTKRIERLRAVAEVAAENGRSFVGIKLNAKYCDIAKRRTETALAQIRLY